MPINPYGCSKLTVERMLSAFETARETGSVSLRCLNAAGADPNAEVYELHEPETHAIRLAVLAAFR